MNYDTRISADSADSISADLDYEGQESRTRRRRIIIIGLVVLAALLAIGFYLVSSGEKGAVAPGQDSSQAPTVSVVVPGSGTIAGTITATGTLAARRPISVGVVGEGGRVVSVPVEQGEWVRAGQVLASIDRSVQNQQANGLRAQIEVARADQALAQNNLDRALQLVERGFISKAEVDRLTATRDAARARLRVAQASYNETLARNARLNILAPASGLLLERNVEPGQTVSAGSPPLFAIAKGGEMELQAQVGETDLAKLSAGVEATVTPVGSAKSYVGQVWQVEPTIDPQNRQGTVRVALSYAEGLRPGGFATATINSGTVVAPMLPESAVLSDDDGSFVYIVDKNKKAQRRSVETGLVTENGIAITSGLNGTEQVVLRAGGFLTEGESVLPKVQKPSQPAAAESAN